MGVSGCIIKSKNGSLILLGIHISVEMSEEIYHMVEPSLTYYQSKNNWHRVALVCVCRCVKFSQITSSGEFFFS